MAPQTKLAAGTGAALLAMMLTTAFAQSLADQNRAVLPTPTQGEAVEQVVRMGSAGYVGDCATASSPQDFGKVCSKFIAQRGNLRGYLAGRTFAEFSRWVFVEESPTGWRAISTADVDDAAMTLNVPWPAAWLASATRNPPRFPRSS